MKTRRRRSLTGKVAFITGAAQGVGFATAQALVGNGIAVAMADVDAVGVKRAASAIGGSAIGLELDVTDHHAFASALDEAERRLGPIDVFINNAGIMPIGPFEDESDATADRVVQVNFHAALFGSKQAVRRLKARNSPGHIINVASGAGWIPGGGAVSYGGSKFAVVGFSQSLAWEMRGTGIDVSVVAPAIIKTQLGAGIADVKGLRKVDADDVAAAILRGLTRPRFAIWVPLEMGVFAVGMSALPYRLRAVIARLVNLDRMLLQADSVARADYEEGISAQSVPRPVRHDSKA